MDVLHSVDSLKHHEDTRRHRWLSFVYKLAPEVNLYTWMEVADQQQLSLISSTV